MSDLISRSALMEDAEKRFGHPNAFYSNSSFKELIDEQPTIEAVPVDRNKIIDEFVKEVMREFTVLELHDRCPTVTDCKIILRDVAEKMKGGAE